MQFRSVILCGLLAPTALAAGPEQIHLSYTGKLGELSVDFVCAAGGAGSVGFSVDGTKTWAQANATFLTYASIGDLQQALISPEWTPAPGAALSYYCACADGSKSGVFDVTPVPARYPSEVFVVFGDFGLVNDVSMASLISDATNGAYDSVLHVGDWAYNMEDQQSAVGCASGDHELDDKCSGVDLIISATCSQNYGVGFFTAVNASHATWSFKTIKADGPGPADYSDSLTIVQSNHGPRA